MMPAMSVFTIVWVLLFVYWVGVSSAYFNPEESKTFVKAMGFFLLLTGLLGIGIFIGGA